MGSVVCGDALASVPSLSLSPISSLSSLTMSGLSTPIPAATIPGQDPGPDGIPAEDPAAASLRARALESLRKARRKPHGTVPEVSAGLPPRPAPSASQVELDYGSEEPAASATSKAPAVATPVPAPTPASAPEPMDVDQGQAREEGEISDTESTRRRRNRPHTPEPRHPRLNHNCHN